MTTVIGILCIIALCLVIAFAILEFINKIKNPNNHSHHWEIIEKTPLVDSTGACRGYLFTLQCKNCGDIKFKKEKF